MPNQASRHVQKAQAQSAEEAIAGEDSAAGDETAASDVETDIVSGEAGEQTTTDPKVDDEDPSGAGDTPTV